MDRNAFKTLLDEFKNNGNSEDKVSTLLKYDLRLLTDHQIQTILSSMTESETKKFIDSITKRTK